MDAVVLIPILSDDAGISMRECPSEEIVALTLEHFSEETRDVVVEDRLIAPRLAQGIAQRRQSLQDLDAAMANILMDERQRVSRRDLDRFVGAGYSRSSRIRLFREENCISSLVGVSPGMTIMAMVNLPRYF